MRGIGDVYRCADMFGVADLYFDHNVSLECDMSGDGVVRWHNHVSRHHHLSELIYLCGLPNVWWNRQLSRCGHVCAVGDMCRGRTIVLGDNHLFVITDVRR